MQVKVYAGSPTLNESELHNNEKSVGRGRTRQWESLQKWPRGWHLKAWWQAVCCQSPLGLPPQQPVLLESKDSECDKGSNRVWESDMVNTNMQTKSRIIENLYFTLLHIELKEQLKYKYFQIIKHFYIHYTD